MAFSFGNANSALSGGAAGGAGGLTQGGDLEVIQTEGLGFLSLAGEAKVQLTSRWSPPPAPTAHLISIASRKGLVAAAGPDAVHIATTDAVRKAFQGEKSTDSEVRPFTPQAKLPLPFRISQLAFTADEQYLVISAESGGGLAVYDVQAVTQGSTQAAFELNTSNETLRALVPNPMPELASFCAIVTTNGNLFMANLTDRNLISGANGPTLRSQVSCAAWSTKGKQIVAGMADGTIYQMTPDGTEKARIPKPPALGDYHVASVTWLENHVFLVVHNATNSQAPAVYHIITRHQAAGAPPTFTYQKITDPVEPFTAEKVPHHSVLRLRDFPPNLQDLLMVASTATESIGLLTRSKTPLTSDKPAESITGVFTTTELADDSRRAQLPMSEDLTETFPIGTAIDLSSKDKVYKPIPTDEIQESPGPLPGLWVLNNEGVLASWWIVYNESIRSGTTYPELAGADATTSAAQPAPAISSLPTAFASPMTKTPSAFGTPVNAAPGFGQPSFGAKASPWSSSTLAASAAPAFGSSSFGNKPASAVPTFGTPSFGASSAAPAFGQSGLTPKASPWASASTGTSTPAFGQSGLTSSGPSPGKVFGSASTSSPSGPSGFANFASKGSGFGSFGAVPSGASAFASKTGSAFASSAPEVSMDADTAFPPPSAKPSALPGAASSPFGSQGSFVLGTTFKADPKTANENEKPTEGKGGSLFGSGFGLSLGDTANQQGASDTKDEDMDAATPAAVPDRPKSIFSTDSTTPTSTPAPQKFDFKTVSGASSGSNIFAPKPASSAGFSTLFGTPKASPVEASTTPGSPKIKVEEEGKENLADIPEAPLPPDTTILKTPTKATATPPPDSVGRSPPIKTEPSPSPEVEAEPAPLPPDFLPKPAAQKSPMLPAVPDGPEEGELTDEGELTEEAEHDEEEGDEGSEPASEGSGIDVGKDLSPTVELGGQTPGFTPQSSFGGMGTSTFSTISRSEAEPGRPLFGEISNAPPLFPKQVPQSPRSPSPVRGAHRPNLLRDSTRSFSAPGVASQILGRKSQPPQPNFTSSLRPPPPVDPNVEAQRRLAAKREAEEKVLVDPEDEGIQQILNSKIEPTLDMNEFLAVDQKLELAQSSERDGIPVACEALWRDINRMIDRLGLNSRSLQSFILGHTTLYKKTDRTKDDLEKPDEWVLIEAEELGYMVENELAQDLEAGRLKDVEETEAAIQSLNRDLAKLRLKEEDMRKIIMSQVDPDQIAVAKSIPLSAEQATQQNELRRSYTNFSNLLAEAEEALTMLRAKIASAGGASGKTTVPTVEAVIRTINKLTNMAMKKSGDIDVLENQMRRLRLGSLGPNGSPAPRSREGSPFVGGASLLGTPQKKSALAMSMMTPERGMRDSLASSVASYGGARSLGTPSPRKKMNKFTEEETRRVREKQTRRKAVFGLMKASLEKSGPNLSRLGDDD
ncbi:hypothetical protein B0H66DRAFT_540121 [Apodospora peruviana]|uniref:Nucleoporin Nup159/Nup146 N-terminal domain-containing protein n=1 Tax=Apodospora peruviana TaxID=516989 RepID=A0AAE0IQ22_9PEZI|nr:hypothetical protein B0H66DRAFT_540121 [Apodospora peruviana]